MFRDERTAWDAYFKNLNAIAEHSVEIGIIDSTTEYPDGTTIQEVAAIQEFGEPSDNIPARPWLATTYYDTTTLSGVDKIAANVVNRLPFNTIPPEELYEQLGAYYKKQMQHIILTFPWTPNSPVTIREKGSSQPLVDTRRFVEAIDWEIL